MSGEVVVSGIDEDGSALASAESLADVQSVILITAYNEPWESYR